MQNDLVCNLAPPPRMPPQIPRGIACDCMWKLLGLFPCRVHVGHVSEMYSTEYASFVNVASWVQCMVWVAPCSGTKSTEVGSSLTDSGLTFFLKIAVFGHKRTQIAKVVDFFEPSSVHEDICLENVRARQLVHWNGLFAVDDQRKCFTSSSKTIHKRLKVRFTM